MCHNNYHEKKVFLLFVKEKESVKFPFISSRKKLHLPPKYIAMLCE